MKKLLTLLIALVTNKSYTRSINSDILTKANIDVTVVGYILYPDGLGRLPIGLIEQFNDKLNINVIETRTFEDTLNFNRINDTVTKIIKNHNKQPGNVSILFDALWNKTVEYVPNSLIKIAYSMFESTQIPKEWVNNLNEKFDAVIVPSKFLISVYKNSGVKIPIFLLPLGMYLEDYLVQEPKLKKNHPFVFGTSATYQPFKNHKLVLEAFISKFGNNSNFLLKLHAKGETSNSELRHIIKKRKIKNVEVISKYFSPEEYINFMSSLDCYVLVSKGEGFSLTPREALAMAIPCILSNNTAHKEICQTSYVKAVESKIKEIADYRFIFNECYGYNFNTSQVDLEQALEEIYINYNYYLEKAHQGREWIKQFNYKNLEKQYLNLIKPKKIILGKKNISTDKYLITNSKKLYEKYLFITE